MKKILIFLMGLTLSAYASMQIKVDNTKIDVDYEFTDGKIMTSHKRVFEEKSEIMVRFTTETPELISQFENRYNLELVQVLTSGFYIYKVDTNTIDKIDSLIDESNVRTVFPAWSKLYRKK